MKESSTFSTIQKKHLDCVRLPNAWHGTVMYVSVKGLTSRQCDSWWTPPVTDHGRPWNHTLAICTYQDIVLNEVGRRAIES
jgi:hypothetical protein